jgi:N6-L-threonylcarbamoyladenine synthase
MIILGIETSCDETSAAVLEQKNGRIQILSNIVTSSASLQAKFGGIIPEQAAREQIKSIIPVIKESLQVAGQTSETIDAIAVTQGPGLIGSLLVGVETAKVLSTVWSKPLIPVNHLIGHFYANWISQPQPSFPCLGLLVSGGHSDLVIFKNHGQFKYLGGTRDDAAGECFDKCARLLNLPYPGGPQISKLAALGKPTVDLPRPMINSKDFDFSFSGLKTAVANLISQSNAPIHRSTDTLTNFCASIEEAIIDVLVEKTVRAAKTSGVEQIIVAGGVAANLKLAERLTLEVQTHLPRQAQIFIPPPSLCTDNGAMIAAAAFFIKPIKNPLTLQANPNLSLAY